MEEILKKKSIEICNESDAEDKMDRELRSRMVSKFLLQANW